MKACAQCAEDFEDAVLVFSSSGEVCPDCSEALEAPAKARLSPAAIVGLGAGFLPFVFSFRTSQSTTVNGQVVSSSSLGYVALLGGGIALLAGVVALLGASKATDKKKAMAVAGAVLLLGALQLARGFGLF